MWFQRFMERTPSKDYTPLQEICNQLQAVYGAKELEQEQIPGMKFMHKPNVLNRLHSRGNAGMDLSEEQLQIRALSIPVTQRTRCYIQGDFTPERSGLLYLAYEEQVGYWASNSNQLYLEVLLARGVTQEDITQNTEHFRGYKKWGAYYWETYGGNGALKNSFIKQKEG